MAQTSDGNAAALRARIHELEEVQQQLETDIRKRMASSGKSGEEIARVTAIIEKKKLEAHQGRTVYFSRRADGTPGMQNYYDHVVSRIEKCGTRHFPKRGGMNLYGNGVVTVWLDRGGNAVGMKIERSSPDKLLDSHMLKIIAASTPFGPTPEQVYPDDQGSYECLVLIVPFEFKHENRRDEPDQAVEPAGCNNL
jgi:protein TonB